MTLPKRRVVIRPDPAAPLHYLRCETPCRGKEWCMAGTTSTGPVCYLGGYGSPEAARQAALQLGYEVA